jgi:hypothetical protein
VNLKHINAQYCGKACRNKAAEKPISRICKHCGREFISFPAKVRASRAIYCSRACECARRGSDDKWLGGYLAGRIFGPGAIRRLSATERKFINAKILQSKLRRSFNV